MLCGESVVTGESSMVNGWKRSVTAGRVSAWKKATFSRKPKTFMLLAESEVLLAESEVLLADSEGLLAESEVLLADSEVLLADSEALLADSEVLLAESEALLAENEALSATPAQPKQLPNTSNRPPLCELRVLRARQFLLQIENCRLQIADCPAPPSKPSLLFVPPCLCAMKYFPLFAPSLIRGKKLHRFPAKNPPFQQSAHPSANSVSCVLVWFLT